jgi:PAS domain S-box-containing protein
VHALLAFLAGALACLATVTVYRRQTRGKQSKPPEADRPTPVPVDSERAVKQSVGTFRQFFDNIEDFLFVLDADARILKVNRTVVERLGYREEELLGKVIVALHPEEAQVTAKAILSDLLAGRIDYCPIQTKGGDLVPVETRVVQGHWNGQSVLFGIAKDIAGVRVSEEKFSMAFHGSPALMALIRTVDLTVFDVNQAFLDVLGYSREEAIGKRPTELNLFVDLTQKDTLLEALLNGRRLRQVEIQLRARSGDVRDGLVSTETLSLSRESLILAVVIDITERKHSEARLRLTAGELERKNQELAVARDAALDAARAKSQFLANMSHEIRTPLNGMLGLAALLSRSVLGSEQQEYVDSITRCGGHLLSILNDILDYSKIEAGHLQIESIPFDLHGLIYDVVELCGTRASPADVELVVDFDPMLPTAFVGDPGRLRQVLGNLVSNAVKFTSRGHILVEVKHRRRDGASVSLDIAIHDTGEGIPEDAQARLFQPFTQADASTSRKHGGTGLGLALCKRIVEGMGGQIVLESGRGKGTTLTVALTLPADTLLAPFRIPTVLAGKRCLVVDDNALVRGALEKQLRRIGLDASGVGSGEEAITVADVAVLDGRPFDVVLIDLYMAGLGGERLAKVLRSDARMAGAGIVMLAPLVSRPDLREAPSFTPGTAEGYLVKPARSEVLAKMLATIVDNQRSGRADVMVTRHSIASPKPAQPEADKLPGSPRILLAEDNDVNQLVMRRTLEELGAVVSVACDGNQALAVLDQGRFDVVVMDCEMPGLDGLAATRRIRESEKTNGGHLPILAVTAGSMARDQERCLAAGMDGYLGKPFGRQELLRELFRIMQGKPPSLVSQPARPQVPAPNIDRGRFKDMAQLLGAASSDGHAMLLRSFQGNTEKRIGEIAEAIERSDAEAVYGFAHAIKGSSGNLGFVGLELAAGRIERRARQGQLFELSDDLRAMREEMGRVREFLQDYFKQTSVQG